MGEGYEMKRTNSIIDRLPFFYRSWDRNSLIFNLLFALGNRLDEAEKVKSNSNGPEQSVIFKEEYRRLKGAMAELPYEQREIVILHCYNGMRFRHIARLQNVSENTAKSR